MAVMTLLLVLLLVVIRVDCGHNFVSGVVTGGDDGVFTGGDDG